jgi:hypothetical protein
MSARHTTITGVDWALALPAARARRAPEAVQARLFSGPVCPICGRPGLHRELTGGTEITHSATERCWHPAAACGNVTTREEAA